MATCAKCGKEASFWHSKWSHRDLFPEFYGKRLCQDCISELNAKRLSAEKEKKTCAACGKKFGYTAFEREWKTKAFHPEWYGRFLDFNCLVQEWKKIPKSCTHCGYYEITKTIYHEDLSSYSKSQCRKFNIDLDIVGEEHFSQLAAMAMDCSSYIGKKEYQEKCLRGEMEKSQAAVQIIVDFSSLKDAMAEGGLVMTSYKCPNCSGMVDLPEAGKILICKYCGAQIKPIDIFEKIKTLIQ